MSGSTTQEEHGELLVAVNHSGARIFLGARGMFARDLAGVISANPGMVPLPLTIALDPLEAGLWVLTCAVARNGYGFVWVEERPGVRRAVLGDMQRFALPPLLPRVEEATAC